MVTIERILCPVDLELDFCNNAPSYAAALARAYNARLIVLACADEGHAGAGEEMRRGIESLVKSNGADDLDWEGLIVKASSPAEAITREAAERRADLIVMCSRRRPLRAALLGSTAEEVCRAAPCPVFVTHPDLENGADVIKFKRIMVAHDFSDYSEMALKYAISLAQEHQAELHLLHVLNTPLIVEPELTWVPSSVEGSYHKAARALQKAVPPEAYLWCSVTNVVRWGKPYREILAYAKEQQIDLVCMGEHGSGFGMNALFGSNVDRVLRQSPCPVLVARALKHSYASEKTSNILASERKAFA